MPELRPYQRAAVDALWHFLTTRSGAPLVVVPTGGGKSHIIAEFLREALGAYPTERALVITHVRELVEQNAAKLRAHWPEGHIGIYSAGLGSREVGQVTVAGIQSVYRRAAELSPVSLVLIDEAHRIPKKGLGMYRKLLDDLAERNPGLRVVGLTATPYRLGSGYLHRGDDRLFTDVAFEVRIRDLLAQGHLCRLASKIGETEADISGVPIRAGEFAPGDLEAAVDRPDVIRGAVGEIVRFAESRRKILVFCAGVGHAENVTRELERAGIPAAAVLGTTDPAVRDLYLAAFRSGDLRALVNVNVLTTGYDEPAIDCLVMLRPTASTALYVQQLGRGMRPHPSKADCLVLDFAGNIVRHGPVDAVRVEERQRGKGGGEPLVRACPQCREAVLASLRTCPACGFVFPREDPHEATSARNAVLHSDDPHAKVQLAVTGVTYSRHEKPGKTPSLRVDYAVEGGRRVYSEWVCLEHDGYARSKAVSWWRKRTDEPVPDSVDEALEVVRSTDILEPAHIVVDVTGQYPRIVDWRELRVVEIPF